MEGKAAARPAVGAAALAACMGALGALATGSGFAQALPEAAQQAAREGTEQRRTQERDARQREQVLPSREARPTPPDEPPPTPLPQGESPCFTVRQIELRGDTQARFGWVLDHLAGPSGLDGPLRRCLGAGAVGVLAQRAQGALIERGFVTSRVLIEPQDLRQGHLVLTLLPGRVRHIRFEGDTPARAAVRNSVPMAQGDVLNLRDIEQALDNFKRVPTVEADIQIVPADEPGWSDLQIRWSQGRAVRLNLSVDDSGSRATGLYQGSLTVSADNPLGLSDLLYVGLQGDLGGGDPGRRDTDGTSWHYSVPWGRALLAIDAGQHRYLQSVAGASQTYAYGGRSASQEATLSVLVHRNATRKTTLHAKAFARQSKNTIDDTEIEVQRRRVGGWQLGMAHRAFIETGTLDLNLSYRRGTGAFGALPAPEEAFGEGTSRFALVQGSAQWQWPFHLGTQPVQYNGQWRAQVHRTPLSPQERFAMGGRYTVRGFDGEATLSAESGWIWRNELVTPLARSGASLFAGIDHGQVRGPSARWLAGTRLTGAVLGVRGSLSHLQYELFTGWPLHKPDGLRTAPMTAGFWFSTSL